MVLLAGYPSSDLLFGSPYPVGPEKAKGRAMAAQPRGICEGCGKSPRALVKSKAGSGFAKLAFERLTAHDIISCVPRPSPSCAGRASMFPTK